VPLIVALAALIATPAFGQFAFTRIADETTPVPGRPGARFQSFGEPSLDLGSIAVHSNYGLFLDGSFVWGPTGWREVTSTGQPVPGHPGLVIGSIEGNPSIEGEVAESVAFMASFLPTGYALLLESAGDLQVVVDESTPLPGTDGETFQGSLFPHLDSGLIVLTVSGSGGSEGVFGYSSQGLEALVDKSTVIPGVPTGETFEQFRHTMTSNGQVAFMGAGTSVAGIYRRWADGIIDVVAIRGQPTPGDPDSTLMINSQVFPTINDEGRVAFQAGTSDPGVGVYTDLLGYELTAIADTNTPRPDGSGLFESFRQRVAIDGDRVAFVGDRALYLWSPDEGLRRVVGQWDVLDGSVVQDILLGPEAMSDGQIVFHGFFGPVPNELTSVLYLVDLPPRGSALEVPALSLAGLVLLAVLLALFGVKSRPVS